MDIRIIQKACGGTEFFARPNRLHLGAQNAVGVDELHFILPQSWSGCAVALYLRRSDGTLLAPVSLDENASITVDRRLTGSTGGQWMLAAIRAEGYTAYTRPGSYDAYAVLPTDGGAEELAPSQYEQFVARVLESAGSASTAAQRAAASAATCTSSAAQAQTAARQSAADRNSAAQDAARAEAAADRAEALAPEEGRVVSVNGKAGIVRLTAQDVGALPCPAHPVSGQLLRVLGVDPDTGAPVTDTTPLPDLSAYVKSSTLPTRTVPGAVKVDPAFGITVRSDGTLTTAPADEAALDSMSDPYAPLTPALLPGGVKKALTTAAAPWSDSEKAAALRTLGADFSAYYTKEDVNTLLSAPSLSAWPVGSIYQTTSSVSPAQLFGGEWEEIARNRVLMGADSTHAAGTTAEAGLPNLTGTLEVRPNYSGNSSYGGAVTSADEKLFSLALRAGKEKHAGASEYNSKLNIVTDVVTFDASGSNALYGASDTVQPAAYYVHIWHRIA